MIIFSVWIRLWLLHYTYQIAIANILHNHKQWLLDSATSHQRNHIRMHRHSLHRANFAQKFLQFIGCGSFWKLRLELSNVSKARQKKKTNKNILFSCFTATTWPPGVPQMLSARAINTRPKAPFPISRPMVRHEWGTSSMSASPRARASKISLST